MVQTLYHPDRSAESANSLKIAFVLPGIARSGGVRVTVDMANGLIQRGHQVRVLHRVARKVSCAGIMGAVRRSRLRWQGFEDADWSAHFVGTCEPFVQLEGVRFSDGETVVAVGSATVDEVFALAAPVIKVRYCHGFLDDEPSLMRRVWGDVPMATLAVSPALVPKLQEYSGQRVLRVVPNGIDRREYYTMEGRRDGVGLILGAHPIKAPEVGWEILRQMGDRFPAVPLYAFGEDPRPARVSRLHYWRYPSVEQARMIYNRCKIWLVVSRNEGFCLPILEAMACGCAVVTSNHQNAAQLIREGENGHIVNFGDVPHYLRHIDSLLAEEEPRLRLVARGLETVQGYSWDRAVGEMEEALLALGEHAPACG